MQFARATAVFQAAYPRQEKKEDPVRLTKRQTRSSTFNYTFSNFSQTGLDSICPRLAHR